jgi:hypothetical protein
MFNKMFNKDKKGEKEDTSLEAAATTTPSSPSDLAFPPGISQDVAHSEAGSLESERRRPRPTTHNSAFDDGFRYQTVCSPLP